MHSFQKGKGHSLDRNGQALALMVQRPVASGELNVADCDLAGAAIFLRVE